MFKIYTLTLDQSIYFLEEKTNRLVYVDSKFEFGFD